VVKRSFLDGNSLSTGLNNDRIDWTKSAGIGIDWEPLRTISIGGNLERSSRDSNKDIYDYTDTSASVNANLFF
jgi:hypothetical protein